MKAFVACLAAVGLVTAAQAQDAPPPAPPLPPGVIGAPGGSGASPAVAEVAASLDDHVLYHPQVMPKAKLPIVLWGNGACRDNGLAYAGFLREVASHGYLVVAVGHARREEPLRPAPAFSSTPVPPAGAPGVVPPRQLPDETQAAQIVQGLDWALAENGRKGSAFYGRLDPQAVAVMGHSCGGLQAIAVAADPRVRTSVILSSGVYNRGTSSGRSQISVTKAQLAHIHGPIAYVNGGPADIAYENAKDDFDRLSGVPALFAWLPVGHSGTFTTAPNGGEDAVVTVGWLDWQLKKDRRASAMFIGTACGLCQRANWTVLRKAID
jgi:dienelactone hydrolase